MAGDDRGLQASCLVSFLSKWRPFKQNCALSKQDMAIVYIIYLQENPPWAYNGQTEVNHTSMVYNLKGKQDMAMVFIIHI